ncbi:lipopolysaccharide biosynthesis protein [Larkinella sp. VNQ87]|uniref:lipopolysaccharide biosynthesis protein n=1 Tax=Larkinella sp. VNQ87 TaxID=3400921 RepID=UPI003C11742A
MKTVIQYIGLTIKYDTIFKWGKLFTIVGLSQSIVQGIGLISGIFIIRFLPTEEYAVYTLANTMLGTMTILADGGISSGIMSQGGKVWIDYKKLGVVLSTGIHLKSQFAIGSVIISIPILLFMLRHHNINWPMTLLIVGSILPAFFANLSNSILQTVFKLHQDIALLQRNQIIVNIIRFFVLISTVFVFPWAFVALFSSGLPQIWANVNLRKSLSKYVDTKQPPSNQVKQEVLKVVKRILPGSIYYCFSSQISVWLISLVGNMSMIATIGGLSRLAMVLTLFSTLFNTLIVPRFSRLNGDKGLILFRYLQIICLLFLICMAIVIFIYFFSTDVLWILGNNYKNLNNEVVISSIGACLSLVAGIAFSLCTSRGWTLNPILSISIEILAIVIGVTIFDISSIIGILIFNIFVAGIQVSMYVIYSIVKIAKI